jgi:hypothetical protein
MPYLGTDFPNATVGETITYFVDFTTDLGSGETLTGATVTVGIAADSLVNDPNAAAVATGPAIILAGTNIVGQSFMSMVFGVKYLVTFTATTSLGNKSIWWSHFFTDEPT